MQGESKVKLLRNMPDNKSFGYALSFVAGVWSLLAFYKSAYTAGFYVAVVAILLLGVALFMPRLLQPFNRFWFVVSGWLGAFVSPIVMGILYFVVMVPFGLLMKLKKKQKNQNSSWKDIDRNIDVDSLNRQF